MCARCIQAWKAALKRRKQLDRQALVVGRVVAANKTAACFHAWQAWVRTRQRHRRLLATGMQQTAAMTKLSALSRWRWWVVERQREVEVCEQVSLWQAARQQQKGVCIKPRPVPGPVIVPAASRPADRGQEIGCKAEQLRWWPCNGDSLQCIVDPMRPTCM